jgi:hypothetical protein
VELLTPKLVGVLSASTFTGLCGHHDNKLFEPIEKHPFVPSTEHVFLLAYRHLCMEVFTKRAALETAPLFRSMDRGRPHPFQQMLQGFADDMFNGMRTGLKDTEKVKDGYDKALVAGDYSAMKYYVVRVNETPQVMCCSGFFPTHDFDGNVLQTLGDPAVTPDHLAFSIIATNAGGPSCSAGWATARQARRWSSRYTPSPTPTFRTRLCGFCSSSSRTATSRPTGGRACRATRGWPFGSGSARRPTSMKSGTTAALMTTG